MRKLFIIVSPLLVIGMAQGQSVGIGTANPSSSAVLDASSTTKGFLPPRMTIAQRDGIINPAIGLVIFCTECEELNIYNGVSWKTVNGTAACVTPFPFPTITIGNQIWSQKNLYVATYKDGTPIPKVTDDAVWASLTTGAYCYYQNDSVNYAATYGKLYNWYAVNDPRGLAPTGWHIPNESEWSTLENYLTGVFPIGNVGGKMKETGTVHWTSPNAAATHSSGFAGLPGGLRHEDGTFENIGKYGLWWTTTEYSSSGIYFRYLYYLNSNLSRNNSHKRVGYSVRCIKD